MGIEPSFSAWKAITLLESNQRIGATERNRTPDLTITNHLLYRLSYGG